jgi:hypothetical protein
MYKEYKIIEIAEGALGTVFLGSSKIPVKKMEIVLNKEVSEGWQVVFQIVERKRLMLFWQRESVVITLGR